MTPENGPKSFGTFEKRAPEKFSGLLQRDSNPDHFNLSSIIRTSNTHFFHSVLEMIPRLSASYLPNVAAGINNYASHEQVQGRITFLQTLAV